MVVTPDPIAARDARFFVDRLCRGRHGEIRLVINKATRDAVEEGLVPDFDWLIDTVGAQLIGVVPYDIELVQASALGQPLPNKAASFLPIANLAKRIQGAYLPLTVK